MKSLHTLALSFALCASATAVDFTEEFDGADLDPDVWEATGNKSNTVADGRLTWNADGGSWASGDISALQPYLLPSGGERTVITWEVGPASITNEFPGPGGQSMRFQLGIHSANETAPRREHWTNTTGGLWMDIDNIRLNETMSVAGILTAANDTKTANTQGETVGAVTIADWDWQNSNREIRLEFDDAEFTWFDGDVELGGGTFADYGIDTEFDNGFRILALGMNFDGGQGTISMERIAATGLAVPTSAIVAFGSSVLAPVSNEPIEISWTVDPSVTALTIDNGLGDVLPITTGGMGSVRITTPVVATQMPVTLTMTATRGGNVETRELVLNVSPPPTPRETDLFDDFDGFELDMALWEHRGGRTFNIGDSKVNWPASGGNWAHGEVDSLDVFAVPEPGKPTTITWTFGPASVTVAGPEDNRAIRVMCGIVSSFERDTWSLQHWQNTSGGIWLDGTQIADSRPGGIAGELYTATDIKAFASNGAQLTGFDIPDWDWQNESHSFTLVVTNGGYTWFNGETELGSSTWIADGIDNEFINGFRIMAAAINSDSGRGDQSLESIEVINGASLVPPVIVTDVSHDPDADTTTLTWASTPDRVYAINVTTDLSDWDSDIEDSYLSQGKSTSYTHEGAVEGTLFYRITDVTDQ